MTKEETQMIAFQIISIAGDAMDKFYQSVKYFKQGTINSAIAAMKEGQARLTEVHNLQTGLIQAEVNEEELPYSLIMTHAQDHLSTAISWGRVCQLLVEMEEEDVK